MPPPKKPNALVDACVVSYNTKDLTLAALKQLQASTEDVDVNLMCWDNGSDDGSQQALVEHGQANPVLTFCSPKNLGYGAALNRAFATSDAPYLLALNSDLGFRQKHWLGKLATYMEENPDVGVVAPLLLDNEGRIGGAGVIGSVTQREIRWWREPYAKRAGQLRSIKECISVCGACMLIRREAFEDCQGFDENYFFYYEETHLHRLMRVYGWKVMFHPEAQVVHLWNRSPNPGNIKQKHFKQADAHFRHVWGDGVHIDER